MGVLGVSALIADIYLAYPRKIARREAMRAIEKAVERLKTEELEEFLEQIGQTVITPEHWLLKAVQAFAASPAGEDHGLFDGYHPPYPATWFNKSRYFDCVDDWYTESKEEIAKQRLKRSQGLGVKRD